MKYFEAIVEFEIEVQTKNATRVKKNKEVYLVQGDSVTFVETKVNEFCKDSHFEFILNKYECDTFFATPSHEGNYTAWTGEQ